MFKSTLSWLGTLLVLAGSLAGELRSGSLVETSGSNHRALLDTYCVTCHNQQLRTAELLLDQADVENVSSDLNTWQKVVGMLQAGSMPPPGMPRPEQASVNAFIEYLQAQIQNVAEDAPESVPAALTVRQADRPSELASAHSSPHRAMLDRYCVTCHNQQLRTGELVLSEIDVDEVVAGAEVWEKVVHKLKAGAMPPAGMPRPAKATIDSFVTHLETELDQASVSEPNPGRKAAAHRLNRAEYANAIRDLLGLEIDAAELLPADDSGGFDNLGDLLSVSPLLMEKYLSAARKISRVAVGDSSIGADVATYALSPFLVQGDRMSEDLPFGSRGGLAVQHHFPLDGEYGIKIRLQRTENAGYVIGLAEPQGLDVRLDGKRVKLFTIGGEHLGRAEAAGAADTLPPDFNQAQYERTADEGLEVRFHAKAGNRLVQVTFLQENFATEGVYPRRSYATYAEARPENQQERSWVKPAVSNVSISGPFDPSGPGETPSRETIFTCQPTQAEAEEACAAEILNRLARRAYRRPVSDEDVAPLLNLFRTARQDRDFEAGIRMALEGLLVSTEFLFRIERDPADVQPNTAYPVTDLELASRLSFFLWSSIPDEELVEVAEQGKLRDPAVLEQQVKRMLQDPRSKTLVENFAGQWLFLRNVQNVNPNRDVFVDFDENLRQAFRQETNLFLESMLREDRPVLDMLTADYSFINERLAHHYGIPDVYGSKFRKVVLADSNRHGLLGQGSILTLTSIANRTSPVTRGKWVLENLLAAPPPPPPPDVPALKEKGEGGEDLPMRAQMEAHRSNPACMGCHAQMDPIGFALENFDAVGQWRTVDAGVAIDASGVLPDGSEFSGPSELTKALLKRPEQLATAVSEKLLMYALGRGLEFYDAPAVRKIIRQAAQDDYRWSSIVLGIVKSTPFQMRRSQTS